MIFRTGERRKQWWCYGSGGDYFDHSNPFLESVADIKGVRQRQIKGGFWRRSRKHLAEFLEEEGWDHDKYIEEIGTGTGNLPIPLVTKCYG